jgi:PPM family protein phosphatase
MELYYTALSDVGSVRTNNEDYLFAGKLKEDDYLFIVADGMGGHKAGEVASTKAVNVFVRQVEKGINGDIHGHLKRIVMDVNEILLKEGQESREKNGMGTTLSVLYIKGGAGYIVHVGDSRIYRFPHLNGNNAMEQLTDDHSFVGRLLKDGFITEEEARNHPRRNVLYQSIGLKNEINIQAPAPFPIQKGQKYLLCSDGLYGVVQDNQMAELLESDSISRIARQMVQKAKANGAPDNITVIIVSTKIDESSDEETAPEDTVSIIVPSLKKKKHRKIGFFIILGLLVLLLAVIIYISLVSADSSSGASSMLPRGNKTITGGK